MRIAFLSDIHANLQALEAVLRDADQQGCSRHVCLGDLVGFNANPAECVDMIRALGCPAVKGDHDETNSANFPLEQLNPVAAAAVQWTRDALGSERRRWLEGLPATWEAEDCTAVHSSLDHPTAWNYVFSHFDAMSSLAYQSTQLCFHGHTHVPGAFAKKGSLVQLPAEPLPLQAGVKYLINAGSVGQPRDCDPRACYVIYDLEQRFVFFSGRGRDSGFPEPLHQELAEAVKRELAEAHEHRLAEVAVEEAVAAARLKLEGKIFADPGVAKAREALAGIKRLGEPLPELASDAAELAADFK